MTELIGMKAICAHMKRSEATVMILYRDMDFPMNKIGGVWESDTELISEWRRNYILNGMNDATDKQKKRPGKRAAASMA